MSEGTCLIHVIDSQHNDCLYDVDLLCTVYCLKELVWKETGFLPNQITLVFSGSVLSDMMTLSYYGIHGGSAVYMVPKKDSKLTVRKNPKLMIQELKSLIDNLHRASVMKYREIIEDIRLLITDSALLAYCAISSEAKEAINQANFELENFQHPFGDETARSTAESTDATCRFIESSPDGLRFLQSILEDDIEEEVLEIEEFAFDCPTRIDYQLKISVTPLPTLMFPTIYTQNQVIGTSNSRSESIPLNDDDFWSETDYKRYLKTKFAKQVAALKQMGFDDEQIILQALGETNGNVQMAMQILQNKFFLPF